MLRLDEMPVVEVHIVPSTDKMGGVGEPGVPPIAPAVANAVGGADRPASARVTAPTLDHLRSGDMRAPILPALCSCCRWRPAVPRLLRAEGRGDYPFATVQKVFQHPRCQNCHIPGDSPLQYAPACRIR